MIYVLVFLFLVIAFMGYWVWGLVTAVRMLIEDAEYMRYCINLLSANSYLLMGTHEGRILSEEEDFQLAIIQKEVSEEAAYLGLSDPFPRPADIETNPKSPD